MSASLNILIVDGNRREVNELNRSLGGTASGEGYLATLHHLDPGIVATIIRPADDGPDCLPAGMQFTDFDGIAWTGSALNAYADEPAVQAQIPLARATVESGVPVFGSCWGMQIVAKAFGGEVRMCPKGREIGIGRHIRLNRAGVSHPLFAGKPANYSALTVHMDEVSIAPPGAVILAGNDHSHIQAFVMENDHYRFWGVQYHPEYTLAELAAIFRRYGDRLVSAGLFADTAALETMAADWAELHRNPARKDLAWRYGIDDDVLIPARRLTELKNWLERSVRPYVSQR
ncbi:type 1 glutamine amidotransferase [Thalassospira sp.]|uniref:type 1 glutamine amidotransferase n=1 Tax=Thalassospira sp. TaxID=1912094 RepID=UPI0027338E22|nr:type 1 glutamine amidotransferase [Thalassospira sp.]MDP2698041.1 type 1 glutamine amidotransferase [Thalassospira sp.]